MSCTESDTGVEHRVTAVEPAWVEATHEYDPEAGELVRSSRTPVDGIDYLMDESSYECSCGESFESWRAAEEHLKRTSPGVGVDGDT